MLWRQHDRIVIVASGPSLSAVDPERIAATDAAIIAVNGAIEWLPRADYWFSLDTSDVNFARMRDPVPGVVYVMACPEKWSLPPGIHRIERLAREGLQIRSERLRPEMRGRPGLSTRTDAVHSGNSAYGALGLAFHMRPRAIALLGVDGTDAPRVEGGAPNDLGHLPMLFETAVRQLAAAGIQVFNGSYRSRVRCFPRMSPRRALERLEQAAP